MNSEDFFRNIKNHETDITASYWKGKQGIYVIEQPLINFLYTSKVYKVGYARESLYTRLRNYKTAYGRAPFIIHRIMQTGSGAKGVKGHLAHMTEKQIHGELDKLNLGADFEVKYEDDDKRVSEWFYNLPEIMRVIATVRNNLTNRITFSDSWANYTDPKYALIGRNRSDAVKITKIEDVKSSLLVATYKRTKRKPKGNLTLGGSDYKNAFEVEPNASKTKQRNIPVLVPKRLT